MFGKNGSSTDGQPRLCNTRNPPTSITTTTPLHRSLSSSSQPACKYSSWLTGIHSPSPLSPPGKLHSRPKSPPSTKANRDPIQRQAGTNWLVCLQWQSSCRDAGASQICKIDRGDPRLTCWNRVCIECGQPRRHGAGYQGYVCRASDRRTWMLIHHSYQRHRISDREEVILTSRRPLLSLQGQPHHTEHRHGLLRHGPRLQSSSRPRAKGLTHRLQAHLQ